MTIQGMFLLIGIALLSWSIAHGREVKVQVPSLHRHEGSMFRFLGIGLLAVSSFLYYVEWSLPNMAYRWPRIFGKRCGAEEARQQEL